MLLFSDRERILGQVLPFFLLNDAGGLDVLLAVAGVEQLLRGMRLSCKKRAMCVKELHSPKQQHSITHRLFILPPPAG